MARRDDRDAGGREHALGLVFEQPLASVGDRLVDDRTHFGQPQRGLRAFAARRRVGDVAHREPALQHREGAHGLFRRVVVGDARGAELGARFRDRTVAEPARHEPLRLVRAAVRQRQQRARDLGARHDRGRRVHEQDRASVLVLEQCGQRRDIPRDGRVAEDVDRVAVRPVGGQQRVEPFARRRCEFRHRHSVVRACIRSEHAGAAAVRDHRQPLRRAVGQAAQRLGREEQVVHRIDAQHADAPRCGIEHEVRARERAGVRRGRAAACLAAPGLDDDDRLLGCGFARGGQELRAVLHRFEVEQDRLRRFVAREEGQQVGAVDLQLVAERHEVREAEPARVRPVEHRGHQRAGLRDEREVAGARACVRKARVEARARRDRAYAVGALDADAGAFVRREQPRALGFVEARGDHDHGARAAVGEVVDDAGHRRGRRADDAELRRLGQVLQRRVDAFAVKFGPRRVDRPARAGERARAQVVPDDAADRAFLVAGAEDGDGTRGEQGIESVVVHVEGATTGAWADFSGRMSRADYAQGRCSGTGRKCRSGNALPLHAPPPVRRPSTATDGTNVHARRGADIRWAGEDWGCARRLARRGEPAPARCEPWSQPLCWQRASRMATQKKPFVPSVPPGAAAEISCGLLLAAVRA